MEKKITFDITKVVAKDLDNQIIPIPVASSVGNVIYMNTTTLEWDGISRKIHAGEKTELSLIELEALESILLGPKSPLVLIVKNPLKEYIDQLKTKKDE